MKKLVMLLLALVMMFSLTIAATAAEADAVYVAEADGTRVMKAAAADTIGAVEEPEVYSHVFQRAAEAPDAALGTNEYGERTFETFGDLKELVSGTSELIEARYAGGAAEFVISENIKIPENLYLYFWDTSVKIPEGVTCTLNGYFSLDDLMVNGKLVISNSNLNVSNSLTVNGTVDCTGSITLEENATITGKDKITFGEYGSVYKNYYPTTEDKVYEALAAAYNDKAGLEYNIYIDAPMVLNSDCTIPANTMLMPWDELIINGICTVEGEIQTYNPITVSGKLVNNGMVLIDDTTMTFSSGASYSGAGELICLGTPEASLVGIDLDEFSIEKWVGGCTLTYIGDKTRLGSATDLTWGVQHGMAWDDEGKPYHDPTLDTTRPGMFSFKRPALDQAEYSIKLYKVGEDYPVAGIGISYDSDPDYQTMWVDEDLFIHEINESGDYYFTVTARGDGINYVDGPTVKSDVWTYVKPAKALTTPTQLSWEWPDAVFNVAESALEVYGCYVEFYHTDDLSVEPERAGGSHYGNFTDRVEAYDWMLQNSGNGYYFFEVMLISNDITKIANSEWSAMSPAYNLTELSTSVESELEKIVASGGSETEIRDSVQALDTEKLKSAMLADQENSGVVANIAALEEVVGGPAGVEVAPEATAFDASKVSIVGANLNNAESESDPVKLVLDKPEKEHVLDTLYSSAVAVSFSMDLENVKDTENLDVPVKITLPVPSTINPEFLVILHYHADGSKEEVHPYIYAEGSQFYAEFVLTSFSDFVMTEYAQEEECAHSWQEATCTEPKTCKTCGATEGAAKGHSWVDATCTAPKTCSVCNATEGEKLPHTFDQEKAEPEYLVSEGVYYKSCKCGEKGSETFTVSVQKPGEFKDVPKGAYYYDAAMWAVANGVTTGTGDGTTFEPNKDCTRGQVVTFLWRAAGEPEPTSNENPFKDVKSSDFFYKAVLWAVENKITTGTGDGTTFKPNATCDRAQIVTFLSRAKNGVPTSSNNPFKDVPAGAYYYNPVLWAVENGVTTGTGDGTTFEPGKPCTRGQVITFLWRAYTK